jgi:hypothetical protein
MNTMTLNNAAAIMIIIAGVLVACTASPIGGILTVLFGLACGSTEKRS